jgi:hypothetical protein
MEQLHGEDSNDRIIRTMTFLRDGFVDYLAARVLLLANLPEQGAILSSTAIEKCAKAVMAFRGKAPEKRHLRIEHWRVLRAEPNFGRSLSADFVELNRVAYSLRYTADLAINYNLVIASREFLAEMDHTILTIQSCYRFDFKGASRLIGYESAIARGDERLFAENHILSRQSVGTFISSKPQAIYEMRRDRGRGLLESRYVTDKPAKRPGFLRQGLMRVGEKKIDYDMSHFPLPGTWSLTCNGVEMIGREGRLD